MSLSQRPQGVVRATIVIDVMLWLLLALLLVPVIVALRALPWSTDLASWTIPSLAIAGLVIGTLLVFVSAPPHWWWVLGGTTIFLGAAVILGGTFVGRQVQQAPQVGTVILGAFICGLCATLPWLIFRAKQAWLGVAAIWLTLGGIWGTQLSAQQTWTLGWVLTISIFLLGMFRLREEMRAWHANHLERIGPVLWPTARAIVTISLVAALLSLAPLGVARFSLLAQWWHGTPWGHNGPLVRQSPDGTPVAVLSNTLSLDAPDISSQQVILTYQIERGPASPPPLVGSTLDTFDGTTWKNTATRTTNAPALKGSADQAAQLIGKVTIVSWPASDAHVLLGFSQPLTFSLPSQARVRGNGTVSALSIADWEANSALTKGMNYTTTSYVLPDDVTGQGTVPADLLATMTAVPADLASSLKSLAQGWVGDAATPAAKANALLNGMQSQMKIDAQAKPPTGTDALKWFLANQRGNVLLYTTAYILIARSIGLPMRLVEGYLPGTYDTATKSQIVRASDATVWAQLAIPDLGWLDLYPGANTQTITIPGTIVYTGDDTPTPTPAPGQTTSPPRQTSPSGAAQSAPPLGVLIGLVIIVGLLGGGLLFLAWRWQRFGAELAPLMRFFARLGLLARLGGVPLRPSDTASQATVKVAAQVPSQMPLLQTLNRTYERVRYGPPDTGGPLPDLRAGWQHLSGALWRLVMTRPWRSKR